MQQDERLREALLEVQMLRAREAKALRETNAVLKALESMIAAPDAGDAVDRLLSEAAQILDADVAGIAKASGSHCQIRQASRAALVGEKLGAAALLDKQRALIDVTRVPDLWFPDPAALDAKSALIVPLGQDRGALFCARAGADTFDRDDLRILVRMSGLAVQAITAQELRQQNALLAAVIAGSSSGFAISDARRAENPLIYVNPAFEDLTGYASDEVLGQNCRLLSAEPADSPQRRALRRAVAACEPGQFLLRNRRRDGSEFWNELTLFPVLAADGTADYLVATQVDASARIAAQRDRDTALRRLDGALSQTGDAFLVLSATGMVQFANASVAQLFPAPGPDWSPGSGFDENWQAFLRQITPERRPQDPEFLTPDLTALSGLPDGREVRLPDGRVLLVRAAATEDGGLMVTATNITPLKTAEKMFRQRAAAAENAQDGIGIADPSGRLIYANSSLARLMGHDHVHRVLGRKWHAAYEQDPAEPPYEDAATAQLQTAGRAAFLARRHDADGRILHHEISLSTADNVGTIIVTRDETVRVEDQDKRTRLREQLETARRQEAVSQLAAGIAHDFNNLLSAINGSALLISSDAQADASLRKHADRITAAGSRAARLVNRLLDLGASGETGGVFDLRSEMTEARELLRASLRSTTRLAFDTGGTALMAVGDATEAVQVLTNLLLNAQDALPDGGGDIVVGLEPFSAAPPPLAVGRIVAGRPYARLRVQDTGKGLPDAEVARLFESYFSTKGAQGTGIGLAMVASILTRLEGAIAVQPVAPEHGGGTRFDIFWPLAQPDDPAQDTHAGATSLKGATLLVVDDEPQVTEVLCTYLESLGAEVAACEDPQIALETLTEDPEAWSAVISDYDMPGFSGGALVQALCQAGVNLPIFIVTALARRLADPRISGASVQGVFAKPVDLTKLAEAVAQATRHPSSVKGDIS